MAKIWISLFITFSTCANLNAQDSSFLKLNCFHFKQQDTVSFTCNLMNYKNDNIHFATLHVWIEEIGTNKAWKFRYPILNGESRGSFIIDSSIENGKYAFNFLVQKSFFALEGQITNYTISQKEINYMMLTKDENSYTNSFSPAADGSFRLKGILFQDTADFVFTPSLKNTENTLNVQIKSTLDSYFSVDSSSTKIVLIGEEKQLQLNSSSQNFIPSNTDYQFSYSKFYSKTTLPDVIVSTKSKKKIEQFDDKYSTGLFKNGNARIFDGLENDQIARSQNFIEFLKGRIAGLNILPDRGKYTIIWRGANDLRRGSNVDIFIDEFQVDLANFDFNSINVSDIAMIKAYPPPAFLTAGGIRGAIAVYTKHSDYSIETKGKYKIKVFGYSSPETIWKN